MWKLLFGLLWWLALSRHCSALLLVKKNWNHYCSLRSKSYVLMAKSLGSKGSKETFFCQNCGAEHTKWAGRCNLCKEWNSIKSFRVLKSSSSSTSMSSMRSTSAPARWIDAQLITNGSLSKISSVAINSDHRIPIFSKELSRVLGGGLVPGSVVLLAGEPGMGKSTLLLQLAASVANSSGDVIYVSGEENEQQIALRAQRLGLSKFADKVYLLCEVDVDKILETIANLPTAPAMVILDSIQTMKLEESGGGLGSISQIRDSTARILQHAKTTSTPFLLIGHVTKTGEVAGPRVLEHMVDAVIQLEGSDRADFRLLRAIKNRFGSASEVGVVEMTDSGLVDVSNPSAAFLSSSFLHHSNEGTAVVVTMEGSRPILAEVQCLVSHSPTTAGMGRSARRASDGFPIQRLLLLCAVIEKRLRLSLATRDIFLNVAGGLRITDPSADLAVAAAIVSSLTGYPALSGTAFLGEVSLGGELRGGRRIDQRIQEAHKLGFKRTIIPSAAGLSKAYSSASVIPCSTLSEALKHGLGGELDRALSKMRHKRKRRVAEDDGNDFEDIVNQDIEDIVEDSSTALEQLGDLHIK